MKNSAGRGHQPDLARQATRLTHQLFIDQHGRKCSAIVFAPHNGRFSRRIDHSSLDFTDSSIVDYQCSILASDGSCSNESVWLWCPDFADIFVGDQASEGLEPAGKVPGRHEVCAVRSRLVMAVVMKAFDGGLFDRTVDPLRASPLV